MTQTGDDRARIEKLKGQVKLLKRLLAATERKRPLCPDCRDKCEDETCLRCQIQALERKRPDGRAMRVLFILQNAWSPAYAGGEWPRWSWLPALKSSRSGQQLQVLMKKVRTLIAFGKIPLTVEFDFHNTTPIVGKTVSSKVPADHDHLMRVYSTLGITRDVTTVVACGKQAMEAVDATWDGTRLFVPHPAYRMLTNDLYKLAARFLVSGFGGCIELKQGKGEINVVSR